MINLHSWSTIYWGLSQAGRTSESLSTSLHHWEEFRWLEKPCSPNSLAWYLLKCFTLITVSKRFSETIILRAKTSPLVQCADCVNMFNSILYPTKLFGHLFYMMESIETCGFQRQFAPDSESLKYSTLIDYHNSLLHWQKSAFPFKSAFWKV